jgi:general secretion pathway protein M
MTLALSPGQRRAAAVALLLASIVLVVAAVAWPVWRLHGHYDEVIGESTDRLVRYQRIAALRPAIEQSIAAVEQRGAKQHFWKGSTPALASAEIQGAVTKIIETHQGRIFSSQTVSGPEDAKAAGPAKVSISIQLTAAIVPLQLILHAIESHQPYLFIDQLSIRANQGRGFKPAPGAQPEFVVQLTVRGYAQPGAVKP